MMKKISSQPHQESRLSSNLWVSNAIEDSYSSVSVIEPNIDTIYSTEHDKIQTNHYFYFSTPKSSREKNLCMMPKKPCKPPGKLPSGLQQAVL